MPVPPHAESPDPSAGLDQLLDDILQDSEGRKPAATPVVPEDGSQADKSTTLGNDGWKSADIARLNDEMSQEIAQLSKEMNACLASLHNWEEERQQRNGAYKEALEACHGFDDEDLDPESRRSPQSPVRPDSPMGEDAQPEDGSWQRQLSPAGASPDDFGGTDARIRALPQDGGGGQALQDDHARIQALRAEVEALRRAEAALAGAPDGPPLLEALDTLQSSLRSEVLLVSAAVASREPTFSEGGSEAKRANGASSSSTQLHPDTSARMSEEDLDQLLEECGDEGAQAAASS